ncbi:hypothetical protein MTR_7g101860 [Medicago truncatula]|uniref:Uncharacterized protein n=1 Tax=Medicago truncatula TaxID=3880 RepID=G7L3V4_MEDTR|nr:hypothetical protein MTR_7g101860 [Medicago truncatula]
MLTDGTLGGTCTKAQVNVCRRNRAHVPQRKTSHEFVVLRLREGEIEFPSMTMTTSMLKTGIEAKIVGAYH